MMKKKTGSNFRINPELKLIIRIIRLKKEPFESEDIELLNKINWEKFSKLCRYHGTIPIVYKKLNTIESEYIPIETMERLKKLYYQIVQFNFVQSNQLIRVLKLLREEGINAIPIKGPVVSMQSYGDVGYRMFQDLDILISNRDFIRTYDLLCTNGYNTSSELSEKKKKLWKRFRRDIEFRKNKTLIDLHQRVTQAHSAFDVPEDQFTGNNYVEILDNKIPVLSIEDTFIYLIINSTKDQWNMLRMIADLSYLIYSNPETKWNVIFKRAKKMGVLRMVLTGIHLMSQISGESLPDPVISEIGNRKKIKELSENYRIQLLFGSTRNKIPDRVKSIYGTLDSGYQKFRYLLYFLFTPTPEDLKWAALPEFLFFLYRIIRPIRLIILALRRQETEGSSQEK